MYLLHIFLRLSEKFEKEAEIFHKQDPDPIDDRHPGMIMYLDLLLAPLFLLGGNGT